MRAPVINPPPDNVIRSTSGKSIEIVLWRSEPFEDGQYQAELVVLLAGTDVPRHAHPNVDSREYHLHGTGTVLIKGREHKLKTARQARFENRASQILASVAHEGRADSHNAFLSLQHWKKGGATFITDDWTGVPWR